MNPKKILYGKEARAKLAAGADQLARAVISTLGPRSRNVAIERNEYEGVWVIHDGVNVARSIKLKDKFEDMGASLLRQAASQTNDLAGDGTTTSILLANHLIQEGLKMIDSSYDEKEGIREQVNPMELSEKLFLLSDIILNKLDEMKKEVVGTEMLKQIANISAQDKAIGDLVAEAIEKVKSEGVVMVEEGQGFETTLVTQDGYQFDNGYLSALFVTNPNRMVVDYQDGYVLLTDMTVTHPDQIVPIIEKVRKDNDKPLLLVANDVVGAALNMMVLSKLRSQYKLVAVIAPEFADRRKESLEDLAILTGGIVITQEKGMKLEDVQIKDLGRFRKLEVTMTHTTISPKSVDEDELEERKNTIKKMIEEEESPFKKERMTERLAKLSQSIAIITVGGASRAEIGNKKEKFIDAISATKAALSEGIVAGGGLALLKVAKTMADEREPAEELIFNMLHAPRDTLLYNAGQAKHGDIVADLDKDEGWDVITKRQVNMFEAGIIDPVKVTKMAVKHAISVAAMVLTTDTLIAEEEKKDESNV